MIGRVATMLIEEQGAALGKRKHKAPNSDRRVQFRSDGQNSLQGTPKSGNYKAQNQKRHYRCRRCKGDHPGTDCQGVKVKCLKCNKLGHRKFECRVACTTEDKGCKGVDQIEQSNCNQCGKHHPGTDCQDDMIGCRICGRLGHRYFNCPSTAVGVIQRSHCHAQTLNVHQKPQHKTPIAPDNTQSKESEGNVQTPHPYPQNIGQTSEVGNDRGALGGLHNALCQIKADRQTGVSSATVAVQKIVPDMPKIEPLEGSNYQRWSRRMLILFEALEVDYVLLEDPPTENASDKTPATPAATPMLAPSKKADAEKKEKFEKDNETVRSHLLAHMNNVLFDLFIGYSSAKKIWDMLKRLYEGDDIGKEKHVVRNLLHFEMVDNKPIMEQIHEYENLVAEILSEGMKMCETFQAHVLLEKVPPSWSDFCSHLKHKTRNLSLQELINHMQTEEANRLEDKRISYGYASVSTTANIVESGVGDKDRSEGKE